MDKMAFSQVTLIFRNPKIFIFSQEIVSCMQLGILHGFLSEFCFHFYHSGTEGMMGRGAFLKL